jgi:endoglucanase
MRIFQTNLHLSPVVSGLFLLVLAACGAGSATKINASTQVTMHFAGVPYAAVRIVREADNVVLVDRIVLHNETLTLPSADAYRVEARCTNHLPSYIRSVTDVAELKSTLTLALQYQNSVLSETPPSDSPDPRYLRAVDSSGQQINQIKDRNGNTVQLRGTNLGGWLVPENWMNGFTGLDNAIWNRFALQKLEERFGEAKADELMNIWQDHWITSEDIDQIQTMGFNTLRVPFGWRNLQKADGSWRINDCGQTDFSRFDWIVAEAQKRNMYVVFDLHNWQSWKPLATKELTTASEQLLFKYDEAAQTAREQATALWTAIARHYKGNGTVAGFDVVNEPTGSYQYIAHQPFYNAIRAEDPERLLIMEWVATADLLDTNTGTNHPAKAWTNILLSDHHYMYNNSTQAADEADLYKRVADERLDELTGLYPYYVGETKDSDQTYTSYSGTYTSDTPGNSAEWLARAMDAKGWHWTTWTYKTVNMGGWGLYQYGGGLQVNLLTDDAKTIADQWSRLTDWQNSMGASTYPLSPRPHQINGYKAVFSSAAARRDRPTTF